MGTSQRRAAIFIGREDDSQSHLPTSKTWARAVTSLQGERGGYYVVSRLDQAGIRALQKVSDLQSPKKAPMDERNKSCYFVFFSYLSLRGTLRYSYYNFPTYDYSLLDTLCRICCLSKVETAAASSGPKFGSISGEQSAVKRLDPKIRPTFCLRLLRSGNVHIRRRDNGMVFHVFSKRDSVRCVEVKLCEQ